VWVPEVLKVELLGQLDDARRGSNVESASALALSLQGVPDLPVRKRLGLDGDDTENKVQ
jgi:hypothetical protein